MWAARLPRNETRDTAWAMSEANVELVREAVDAFNRGDVPAFLEALDANVELDWGSGFISWGDTYRGHAGIERWLRGFRQFRDSQFVLEVVADRDPYVVAVIRTEGMRAASGAPATERAAGLLRDTQRKNCANGCVSREGGSPRSRGRDDVDDLGSAALRETQAPPAVDFTRSARCRNSIISRALPGPSAADLTAPSLVIATVHDATRSRPEWDDLRRRRGLPAGLLLSPL
jgi:ketosteroid isomerase-like protein